MALQIIRNALPDKQGSVPSMSYVPIYLTPYVDQLEKKLQQQAVDEDACVLQLIPRAIARGSIGHLVEAVHLLVQLKRREEEDHPIVKDVRRMLPEQLPAAMFKLMELALKEIKMPGFETGDLMISVLHMLWPLLSRDAVMRMLDLFHVPRKEEDDGLNDMRVRVFEDLVYRSLTLALMPVHVLSRFHDADVGYARFTEVLLRHGVPMRDDARRQYQRRIAQAVPVLAAAMAESDVAAMKETKMEIARLQMVLDSAARSGC